MQKITDEIFLSLEKPARYIAGEVNMVEKNDEDVDIHFAFCFPDIYEIAMSHLGMEILYFFLNRREDTYCERVFAPWVDMEAKMIENDIELFSLERRRALKDFDIVAFTLQYELSYSNIINMLKLAKINPLRKDRKEEDPLIICGGSGAYNPEPLADFVDFFYLGEGEVLYDELLDIYKEFKKAGKSKDEYLLAIIGIEGIYIPKFYDVEYKENGEIKSFNKNHEKAPDIIKKVIVKDFDKVYFPEKTLVPLIEIVHDRVTLEIQRGCIRGCRFCQAGYIYRPVREKKVETLLSSSEKLLKSSGYDEVSLCSLSSSDYHDIDRLIKELLDENEEKMVNVSLPSLRIDTISNELLEKIKTIRKAGLTFAPEAGSQRLRDVINKNLTEEDILKGVRLAFENGWQRIKLYFMLGLPSETEEDVLAICELIQKVLGEYKKLDKKKRVSINVSNSCFVPKPFTPFQWEAQDNAKQFLEKALYVKKKIQSRQISYSYHEVDSAIIEGVFARGDRRLSKVLLIANEKGIKFDSWQEYFNMKKWQEAFDEAGLSIDFYTQREREYDEILPWDHISIGVDKAFFIEEREKSLKELTTENCKDKCSNCGAASFGEGVCHDRI